jgi:ribosomal protein L16 Arg81 hydroxylase
MLSAILAPVTKEEFFRDYWTKSFLHVPGATSKFSHLFSWEVLNRALEEHRFDEKRLRLVRSNFTIQASRYLHGNAVNSAGLINELANGATLVLNQCDEVHRPLRDLCEQLQRLFHRKVITNLYASWKRDNGFAVHWDDHDVLILQIAGRKRWKVWEPTRRFPFRQDVVDTSTAPGTEPFWTDVLETGGLLNIPRGWWHVAYPLDEPCLHLTVGIQNHNGIDLLRWLADSMKSSEAARMELPLLASREERAAWLATVRADLLASFDDELLSRFLSDQDARALPRPVLALPEDVRSKNTRVDRNTLLELAIPGPIQITISNGKALCQASGEKWEVNSAVGERLRRFNDGLPHSLAELASPPDPRVNFAVGMLLMKGLLRRAYHGSA